MPVNSLQIIGFDMGGTSTDVSRYAGVYEHVFETTTAGVTIQAPQLDVNTVAAGETHVCCMCVNCVCMCASKLLSWMRTQWLQVRHRICRTCGLLHVCVLSVFVYMRGVFVLRPESMGAPRACGLTILAHTHKHVHCLIHLFHLNCLYRRRQPPHVS